MDKNSFTASCEYLNETFDYQQAGAMLIITVDGSDRQHVEREYESIGRLCLDSGGIEVYVADNATTSERIWNIRRNIPEAYNLVSKIQSNEDLVVPPAAIPAMLEKIAELEEKYGLHIPCYGHAGDGNIHARIFPEKGWSEDKWAEMLPDILSQLYERTAELGGRISGEHGIGHKRKDYMGYVVSNDYLDMLKVIKRAFDPNNVLNPGKIFDLD